MLPRVSARSSVSAARDGAGTTTTSTELLTMVVDPALPMNCTSARLLIERAGRRRGGGRGEQQPKRRAGKKRA